MRKVPKPLVPAAPGKTPELDTASIAAGHGLPPIPLAPKRRASARLLEPAMHHRAVPHAADEPETVQQLGQADWPVDSVPWEDDVVLVGHGHAEQQRT